MQVFENATFISCEDHNRLFKYLVTDAQRIVYSGDELPERYAHYTRTDLAGACVVPAFADTHNHFASFSLINNGLDCRDARDLSDQADIISSYLRQNPDEKTILGFGCSAHTLKERRLPERSDLDRVTDRPMLIVKYDGHAAVGNSALIKTLPKRVTSAGGFDEKSGWFYQDSFYKATDHLTKAVSPLQFVNNLIGGADYMARQGIGLVHTMDGVGFPLDMDVDMMRFASRGLPQQFRVYFQTMNVKKVLRRKMTRIGGCFLTALDGCFGSEDAALREPYSNNSTNSGVLVYDQQTVSNFAKEANRAGLQIELHAIGDAAVDQAINAIEDALNDCPREDHRHTIIHACLMDREQIERAAKLDIHIALQTPFLHWEQEPMEYIEALLGERTADISRLKSMLEAGLVMASGSDAPCTLPDPIFGIWAACNHPDPSESIDALNALRMHTSWAARISFDEQERGTLTDGKIADFTVLDKNPLEMDPAKLNEIKVTDLYLGGKRYEGPVSGPAELLKDSLKDIFMN